MILFEAGTGKLANRYAPMTWVCAKKELGIKAGVRVVWLAVAASALLLITASGWSSALAQGGPSREAPVGHRQPKASEVPPDQQLTPAEKRQKELDQALDKKLKSICRGC